MKTANSLPQSVSPYTTMRMYTPALIRPYIYTLCHLPVIENCLT